MSNLIKALFPEGHRKVMVNLIIVGIAIALEKLGGGLSNNMETILIAIAGIFTGGNVLKGLGDVIGGLKGTKVGQIIEDIIPGDQGLGIQKVQAAALNAEQAAEAAVQRVDESEARLADIEKKLAVQAQNTSQIVQILNSMRQTAPAARPPGAP